MKFYGTENETFVITKNNRVFLIQSQDMTGECEELKELPPDAAEISPALLDEGVIVPDDILAIEAAVALGSRTSARKKQTSAENGRLGGRPVGAENRISALKAAARREAHKGTGAWPYIYKYGYKLTDSEFDALKQSVNREGSRYEIIADSNDWALKYNP